MRRDKYLFNQLLLRYRKYSRKLQRLELTGRNVRRQSIIQKHIERLRGKLESLYASIRLATSGVLFAGAMMMVSPEVAAQQTFSNYQQNPFGISSSYEGTIRPTLVDLDGDNVLDIVMGYEGRFYYYHNSGTAEDPSFDEPVEIASDISRYASPSFADVDSDGDMDMIASGYAYDPTAYTYVGRFFYFKNTRVETGVVGFEAPVEDPLGLPALDNNYYFISSQMGDVDGDGDLDMVYVHSEYGVYFVERDDVTGLFNTPDKLDMYIGYSSVSLLDLDEDGDLDLFYTDWTGLIYKENTAGINNYPVFVTADPSAFRINDSYSNMFITAGDLDDDGDLDLMAGANGYLLFFENATFAFQASVSNPFSLSSPGQEAQPYLVDIDGDGDLDLFSGLDAGAGGYNFPFFENTGTSLNPSFGSIQYNPFELSNIGYERITVSFADLDDDGDMDMLAADYTGNPFYMKNRLIEDGSVSFETAVSDPFNLSNLGSYSRFFFADMDDDQDVDLIIGKEDGTFTYIENDGTVSTPSFSSTETVILSDIGWASSPTAIDFDGDEDFDIFAGTTNGIYYFENIGSKTSPSFASPVFEPFGLFDFNQTPKTPNFGDLDGDNDLDLIAGYQNGGFMFFEFESPVAFTSSATAASVENNEGAVLDVNASISGGSDDVGINYSISGTDKVFFTIDASGLLYFNPPADYEAPSDTDENNIYEIVVVAGSNSGASSQAVQVTVTDVVESSFAFTSQPTITIDENVTEAMTVRASQTDTGGAVSYAISGGDDQAAFSLDASTGVLSFLSAVDADIPGDADGNNVYLVDVEATDASGTINQSLTITVQDVNDNTVMITSPGSSVSVVENTDLAATIVAEDNDITASITYTLGFQDADKFTIDASGQLFFKSTPDYENPIDAGGDNFYNLQVTASDGTNNAILGIVITITNDPNEAPKFESADNVSLQENSILAIDINANDGDEGETDAGVTYSVAGTDGALFTIDESTGQLDFIAAPDRESPSDDGADNVYNVEVTADDGVNQTVQAIAITVTDANDNAPQITSSSTVSVDENVNNIQTVTVTDVDTNNTFTFSITGGDDQSQFQIDETSGELSFNPIADFEAPTDLNGDNEYMVEVTVSDGIQSDNQLITVTVSNVNEANLSFTVTSYSVAENQLNAGVIRASVPDGASAASYSISGGDDAAAFELDASTGVLSFLAEPNFESPADFNTDGTYSIEITATSGVQSLAQLITIEITDVNDAPVITLPDPIIINETPSTEGITFTATDEDGDNVIFTITGGEDGDVSNTDGVNKAWRPADYANQTFMWAQVPRFYSASGDNTDYVELTATDGKATTVRLLVIEIQDVNTHTPSITTTSIEQVTGTTIVSVDVTDGDPTDVLSLSIVGGVDQALFTINGDGELEFLSAPDFESPSDDGANNVYDLTLEVTDGTFSSQSAISITVIAEDVTAPVITRVGNAVVSFQAGSTYKEFGATALDNVDGDITDSIVIDVSAVDMLTVGGYTVTYDVTDAAGNAATQVTRTVNVFDNIAPEITLNGDNPLQVEYNDTYIEFGAIASDNTGDLTADLVIDASAVNTSVLGSYDVTYDVSDASGNTAVQVIRTVNVVDTTVPTLTLNGSDPQVIEVGGSYSEQGATANDNYDGDVSGDIVIDASAVNTSVLGSYSVTYDVTDSNGNTATQLTRTVNVVDTTVPVITLTGVDPQEIEVGGSYAELGAYASDNYEGDISGDIVIDASAVDMATVGSYTVTYDVTDDSGNAATQVTRTVNVVDTTAPIITLTGANPQEIQYGGSYEELGATASDNYDGDISGDIVIDASAVNTSVLGSYDVTYDVSDASGNTAVQVIRTVNVVDATVPVISLTGANVIEIEVGGTYTEQGATAADNYDGDLTSSIVVDNSTVNTSIVGSYSVTYDVTDTNGNAAVQVTRTVNVVDNTVPVITLTGLNPQELEVGGSYSELGATASDNYDGDISGDILIDASAVDMATVGSYTVTYDVTDATGNAATQVTRTVNVVDTTAPIITLTGANPQEIQYGGSYEELGATASDNYDGDISSSIVIDASEVNTNSPGDYTVTYNVTDANGNAASEVSRTVSVVKANQTITFGSLATKTFGDAAFDLSANATSGLSVTYSSSNTSVAIISGNTVTIVGAGSTIITANQTGDGYYNAATAVTQTLTVDQASQTITFDAIADVGISAGTVALGATASSGLSVTYSVVSGPATVTGAILTLTGTGTVVVMASQPGNTNYLAATDITQSFDVTDASKEDQTITFDAIADKAYGDVFSLTATASSGLAVTYTVVSGSATLSGSELSITGLGSVTIQAAQTGDDTFNPAQAVSQTFVVSQATLTVTANDQSINVGDVLPAFTITYSGFVNGEDVSVLTSIPTASVSITDTDAAGIYGITVSGGEATNYAFSYVEGTLTINKALGLSDNEQILVYPNPATDYILVTNGNAVKVDLYDLKGTKILTSEEVSKQIGLGKVARGLYVVKVYNAEGDVIHTEQIIKR